MVSLQKIYDYLSKCKPDKVADYSAFFENKESISEDRKKEIQADLAVTLEEIASKEPGFVQCAQPGLVLSADHPDVKSLYGKKFLPGGMHSASHFEQAISGAIYGQIVRYLHTGLCRDSGPGWYHDSVRPLMDVVVKGFEKIKITAGKHSLVYHPYSIIKGDMPKIRDLSSGLTYNTSAADPIFTANTANFDKKPLPGSYVKMPVIDDDGLFFYPKETAEFNASLADSLEINFKRVLTPINRLDKIVKRVTSDENWKGSLDNVLLAEAELYPDNTVIISPKSSVNLSLDFKSGKIFGLDKEADFASYIIGGMCLGTGGGVVLSAVVANIISANAIYSAPIMSLGVLASLASGVISTLFGCLYYQNCVVKPEEEQSQEVMKRQWQSTSVRIF